ncbi:MAG: membrane protein insertase YidC [Salinivirgaceae bacterium]|nr:membrane protein insertase YidC [Salinivirgaceae bacterium]
MNLLDIILSPFLFIIKQTFLLSYNLTGNYGISIILLSFAISLLLLPIFILIEKAKKKDDTVKFRMQPLLDEIKRCYKGQERYYYIRTLNRQFSYSPLRALIPILSLLLQIPFFIAAYQFLESYEPLAGIGFWFIKDLNAPDALFGAINILPIAMTLVNLLTAYFYTRNGNTSERKQMLVVAGIFLILLFKLPAGLVLYWTMNNVFSFFRLFITNREVFKKEKTRKNILSIDIKIYKTRMLAIRSKIIKTFAFLSLIAILSQLNWAFQHSFSDISYRVFIAITVSFIITLFIAILCIFHKIETINFRKNSIKELLIIVWLAFKPTFIFILTLAILSQINWALKFNFDDIYLRILLSFIASIFTTLICAAIVYLYQNKIFPVNNKVKYTLSSFGILFKISFIILLSMAIISQINWSIIHNFNSIILRISIAFIGSWILIIFIANTIHAILRDQNITAIDFRNYITKPNQSLFINSIFIAGLTLILLVYNTLNTNANHFICKLLIALLIGGIGSILLSPISYILKKWGVSIVNLKVRHEVFFSLFFLGIYFHLSSKLYYSEPNINLSIFGLFSIIMTQFIALAYFIRSRKYSNNSIYHIVSFSLVLLFIFQLINSWVYFKGSELSFSIFNTEWLISNSQITDISLLGILFSTFLLPFYFKESKLLVPKTKPNWIIYALCVFYLSGFIFLWNPLTIYSTFPETFEFPAIKILRNNLPLFISTIAILSIFYLILPKKFKRIWLITILTLTVLSFIHNSIIPIHVGTLQENKFVEQDNLSASILLYLLEGIAMISFFLGIKNIRNKLFLV